MEDQVGTGEFFHGSIGQQGTQLDALGHFGYLPNGPDLDTAVFHNQWTGAEVFDMECKIFNFQRDAGARPRLGRLDLWIGAK